MAKETGETPSPTERLRADILGGDLAPGERLPEVGLAQRYGVGRGAIRTALVELRGEGLVEIEANRGAMVRRIGLEEAIQIAEARKVLEALIAGRAAANHDRGQRETLRPLVAAMEKAVSAGDNRRYSELNRELHHRIWEIGGHRVANDLVTNLRNRSAHHQYRLAVMPGRAERSLQQHADIVDAIVAGDVKGAERAMREHLESVVDVLTRWSDVGAP